MQQNLIPHNKLNLISITYLTSLSCNFFSYNFLQCVFFFFFLLTVVHVALCFHLLWDNIKLIWNNLSGPTIWMMTTEHCLQRMKLQHKAIFITMSLSLTCDASQASLVSKRKSDSRILEKNGGNKCKRQEGQEKKQRSYWFY